MQNYTSIAILQNIFQKIFPLRHIFKNHINDRYSEAYVVYSICFIEKSVTYICPKLPRCEFENLSFPVKLSIFAKET